MPITATPTDIEGLLILEPRRFGDHRGYFCETWAKADFAKAGIHAEFIQDNHAFSAEPGTLRGLHFQAPPNAQAKLLRCVRGSILDVAVDIRKGSTTYGQHVAITLSADNWKQLFVPRGFAHAYLTLEPNTHVLYKVDGPYSPPNEGGLMWNDPDLGIDWGREAPPIVSGRDNAWAPFRDFQTPF